MLEKTIKNMKDENTKVKQANDLKLKTEEDFYKEVIEAKQANILLTDHIEIIEKEKGMLEEKIKQLEKTSKMYIVKMEEKLMEKDENAEEHEWIQEEIMKNVQMLLGKNTELNIKLGDILEETDETLEEYKKENKDLRFKVWKAIKEIGDEDEKLKELELEIETISNEHEELESKLIDKD